MPATWTIQTAPIPGAVAVIQLAAATGAELEAALQRLGIATVPGGGVSLRDLFGIDRGLVARWSETSAHIMPHGGIAVVRGIASALAGAGLAEAREPGEMAAYPEARTPLEARVLSTLARAASPLAVDLLLDQPRRWAVTDPALPGTLSSDDAARHSALAHLIAPPLVVAIGPPNTGKSSLLNALAGRTAAIVADEPGTTRDHIGVHIDMAGLMVRYIDTPGVRETTDSIETEAHEIAQRLAALADLVLCCGDVSAAPVAPPRSRTALTIATRIDLGRPTWPFDGAVSAKTGAGLPELVSLIRDRLVPPAALTDPRPWCFWP